MNVGQRLLRKLRKKFGIGRVRLRQKIFCIGMNKTGTTSLKEAFLQLGCKVGNQREAEMLLDSYLAGDYEPLIRYCSGADVFQDFPFSYPNTFAVLDKAFPGSKFILSIRDSPEQWYNSLVRFHSKMFGHGYVPTARDLQESTYVYKGWAWKAHTALVPEGMLYNKSTLIGIYQDHCRRVVEYFEGRSDDLLVLNLSEDGSFEKFKTFLGIGTSMTKFPWVNKTSNVKIR